MSLVDRRLGLTGATAFKQPCRVATTANITLSGLQTIDGVALAADDRVLVKNQTDATTNGIYVADTSSWERSKDFNGSRDVVQGTLVNVAAGSTWASTVFELSTASPVIGTTSLNFDASPALNARTYSVATMAALKALVIRPPLVSTLGYTTAGIGAGDYAWVAGSTKTADDGYAVQCTSGEAGRYILLTPGDVTTDQYGIKTDLTTGQSARLQTFFNTCVRERLSPVISSSPWLGQTITAITDSGGLFKITTAAAHGQVTGATMFVQDSRAAPTAGGQWVVTVVDATSVTLNSSTYVAPSGVDYGTLSPSTGINCEGATIYVNNGGTASSGPVDGIQIRGVSVGGTPVNGLTGGSALVNCYLHVGVGPNYTDKNGNKPDGNAQFVSRHVALRSLRLTGHLELWNLQVGSMLEQVRVTPNGVGSTTRGIYAYACNTLVAVATRCDNGGASLDGWVLDTCPDIFLVGCADNRSRIGLQFVQEVRYGFAVSNVTDNGSGLIRVATTVAHGLSTGNQRYVIGVVGVTIPTTIQTVTVIDATTVDLQGSSFAGTYVSGGTISTQPNGSRGSNVTGGFNCINMHLESNYEEAAIFSNLSSGSADVRLLTQDLSLLTPGWTKPRIRIGHPTDVLQKVTQFSLCGDVRGRVGYPVGSIGVQVDHATTVDISSNLRVALVEIGVNITANSSETSLGAGHSFTLVDIPVQTVAATDEYPARGFGGVEYRASGAPDTTQPLASIVTDGEGGLFTVARMAADTTGANYRMRKARGTPTAPAAPNSGDALGSVIAYAYDGVSTYRESGRVRFNAAATPTSANMFSRFQVVLCDSGTTSPTTIIQSDWQLGLRLFGSSVSTVRADGAVGVLSTTVASLGTATAGLRAQVTDSNATLAAGIGNVVAGGGANVTPVYADGTNWRIG